MTLCGSGIGSLVSPILTFELIRRFGWRMAYPGLARTGLPRSSAAAIAALLGVAAIVGRLVIGSLLDRFGMLFGTIAGLVTLAGGLGPWVLSLIYDATGGYALALRAFVPTCAVSATLFAFLGPYPPPADAMDDSG